MKWLEDPHDEAERQVREGLDLAARRTDELALRRIWSRLVDSPPREERRRWPFLLGGGALALAGALAASVALLWPLFHDMELDAPYPMMAHATARSEMPPQIADPLPVLLGPATVRTGLREARSVRLKGGARVDLGSETTLAIDAGQRPALERGRVGLEVPHQQPGEVFTVVAGPYVIVVVGTKFDVGVGKRQVQVDVREGVVEVWRDGEMVRLTAGKSWKGPVPEAAPRPRHEAKVEREAPAPEPSASERFASAKAAIAAGDTSAALAILRDLAQGEGPTAENSSYEIGRVLRDLRAQPREALNVWSNYRARFPHGLLRMEADVSIVETLLELGDRKSALHEAKTFLDRYPRSERRAEMSRLVEQLQRMSEDDGSSVRASR